jgi:hypothetical protein
MSIVEYSFRDGEKKAGVQSDAPTGYESGTMVERNFFRASGITVFAAA